MPEIPKIQIRGSFILIIFALLISCVAIYVAKDLSVKNTQTISVIEKDIADKRAINVDSLNVQETSLKKQSDSLNEKVSNLKKKEVTKFNKDVFATTLSTFAEVNDLKLAKLQQDPVVKEKDGFYTVKYNISLNGSMYGMMEFFNLLNALGSQYSVDYFSFRQEGSYSWLQRETDQENMLSWVGIAKETIEPEKLQEIIDLSIKVENDNYDYGTNVSVPTTDPNFDPLENLLNSLMQEEKDPDVQKQYEADKLKEDEKTKAAQEAKSADIKTVNEFLKQYYPAGTVIKGGQLIVPMLDGNMVFDVGISFTGNDTGADPKTSFDQYLIPPTATTSTDRNVRVVWNGETKAVPSVINGVDVSELNGINLSDSTKFVVSWNNNQLSKNVLESFLAEKGDGGYSEFVRVAAEIRFLQKNGKTNLELTTYLIFLYEYLVTKGVII